MPDSHQQIHTNKARCLNFVCFPHQEHTPWPSTSACGEERKEKIPSLALRLRFAHAFLCEGASFTLWELFRWGVVCCVGSAGSGTGVLKSSQGEVTGAQDSKHGWGWVSITRTWSWVSWEKSQAHCVFLGFVNFHPWDGWLMLLELSPHPECSPCVCCLGRSWVSSKLLSWVFLSIVFLALGLQRAGDTAGQNPYALRRFRRKGLSGLNRK